MDIPDFLKTIYLGDRTCRSITIDGQHLEVRVQVDCISRVRASVWNFYTAEDITDGWLVFTGVKSLRFDPPGLIPNDLICSVSATSATDSPDHFLVSIDVVSIPESGDYPSVLIQIVAASMHLEDPKMPGLRIVS